MKGSTSLMRSDVMCDVFTLTALSSRGILGKQSDCLMRIHCHKVQIESLGRQQKPKCLLLWVCCANCLSTL